MTNLNKVQLAKIANLGLTVEIFNTLTETQQKKILDENFEVEKIKTKKSKLTNNIQSVIDTFVLNSGKLEFNRNELLEVIMLDNFSSFFHVLNNGQIIKEVNNFQELSLYFTLGCNLEIIAENKQINAAPKLEDKEKIIKRQWQSRANNILNEISNVNHAKYYNTKDSGLKHSIKDLKTKSKTFTFELI